MTVPWMATKIVLRHVEKQRAATRAEALADAA
jgi:hypothetical protein